MKCEAWMYVFEDPTQPFELLGNIEARVTEPASLTKIGIALRQVRVLVQNVPPPGRRSRTHRFAIILDSGRRDDEFAQRFVDAYSGAFTLLLEPLYEESQTALRLPLTGWDVNEVNYSDLVEWNPGKLGADIVDSMHFTRTINISPDYFDQVWRLLPILLRDPYLVASHYLDASLRDFSSYSVAQEEALGYETNLPSSQRQSTLFESALQNAYKVVEALIGEPPNDDRALREKLEAVGVDPITLIDAHWTPKSGYCEYLLETVKSMHRARDKRTAHVRTPNREPLSYTELSLFQQCAWVMLRDAVERELEIDLQQEERENDV